MQRNKITRYSLTCLLAASLLACKLDETPYSSIYTDTFYKTQEDAEAALTAVYTSLADLYNGPSPLIVSEFSADQLYPRPVVGRDTYTLFGYDPDYTTVRSYNRVHESPMDIWNKCYEGIERANWVLERVPNTNMNEARKQQILAEARFMRAWFHWMLTKNFGSIVVRTRPSKVQADAYTGKSEPAAVYEQIYADLDSAILALPDYSANVAKGRPSKQVAQALYAKAALYNEDLPTALEMARTVLNSSVGYRLMDNVVDVYDVAKEDPARQENMWAFEAESSVPSRASQMMGLCGPPNSNGPAYGKMTYGSIFAYPTFFASFDPADQRRKLLDTTYIDQRGNVVRQANITPITRQGVLVKKYMDPNSIGGSHAVNIPLLRLADVYLIAAEAEARANGPTAQAYTYINTVRRRAGLPDLGPLDQQAFIAAVLRERSWELFAEGDRWYDLTRTNTFLQVIPRAVNDVFPSRSPQPKHRYFPIPQSEVNANPELEQNPDWQ